MIYLFYFSEEVFLLLELNNELLLLRAAEGLAL